MTGDEIVALIAPVYICALGESDGVDRARNAAQWLQDWEPEVYGPLTECLFASLCATGARVDRPVAVLQDLAETAAEVLRQAGFGGER